MNIDMNNNTSTNHSTATQRFFWWLAGANIPMLEECRGEWHKSTAIGCFVLIVGVLAVISGTFFLMGSLNLPWGLAAFGGLLWGFGVIIPLDRVLLTHFHKGDGALIRSLPRLVLALMIALVVNHPLLLTIFKGEIDARLLDNKSGKLQTVRSTSDKQTAVARLNEQIAKVEGRLAKLQEVRDKAKFDMDNERSGIQSESTTGRIGEGTRFEIKKKVYESAQSELDAEKPGIDTDLAAKRNELVGLMGAIDKEVSTVDVAESNAAGMLNRNKALMAILKEEPDTALFALCLFLLLLSVETLPITQKLWSRKGKYDFMLDEETKLAEAEAVSSYGKKKFAMDREAKADRAVAQRIVESVESGQLDLDNQSERDLSTFIHMNILRRQARQFGFEKNSGGSKPDGAPIFFEVIDYSHLTAQVTIPGDLEGSMTLDDLSSQVEAFSREVAVDLGPTVRFVEATNSAGEYIDRNFLPLVGQLKLDRKLLMKFEPLEAETDTAV